MPDSVKPLYNMGASRISEGGGGGAAYQKSQSAVFMLPENGVRSAVV